MAELDGKTALVTGAASGIGAASARALAAAGARVVLADIDAAGADKVAESIRGAAREAMAVAVDVADEGQVEAMVESTVRAFGGIDILHNNAALTNSDFLQRDQAIHQLDTSVWDQTMTVNLRGYMLGVKYAVPHMIRQGGGVIVNTTSGGGLLSQFRRAAYGTSKAAIVGFTRNVATQYGRNNIRCVAVSPGAVLTPAMDAYAPPQVLEMLTRHNLLPRLGTPEDIADAVAFLASDRASFITGVTLPVDGGITSHISTYVDETLMDRQAVAEVTS
ncbi:SDR family NAD(P)-dependent oxidoreductase [Mycobacterium avium]|uniref:SDR family NAD(P)-dependent oxidoreductase n=1 Tax=Mycobacterium avium TaxID=1764 RepID=UPI001CC6BECE|nr:glucose 1-dehydrogenase [Mycobacterium avium]MBZ4521849.1 glucose 1-dehydrogenase [Mycobacterium avium subsp. hominissuis]MBZ4531232.1 glucose 1-dehydrogenase [Mycobacterium avium subsp. hominissuis]